MKTVYFLCLSIIFFAASFDAKTIEMIETTTNGWNPGLCDFNSILIWFLFQFCFYFLENFRPLFSNLHNWTWPNLPSTRPWMPQNWLFWRTSLPRVRTYLLKDLWRNERNTPKDCIFWKYIGGGGGSYYTPGLDGGRFFGPWVFIIPKSSYQDLSNEGSNIFLSSLELVF